MGVIPSVSGDGSHSAGKFLIAPQIDCNKTLHQHTLNTLSISDNVYEKQNSLVSCSFQSVYFYPSDENLYLCVR